VQRRPIGRSADLTVRMLLVLALVAAAYAAVGTGIVELFLAAPHARVYVAALGLVILATAAVHLIGAQRLILRSAGLTTSEAPPELRSRLARLAAMADLPTPRLELAESRAANAFTVGIRRSDALIVVTTRLTEVLDQEELDAVLAHELAHIVNRDAAVMTIAGAPRTLGAVIAGASGDAAFYLWFFIWPLGLPILAFGTLLTLAISRAREFAADRGSALLTGRPEDLMSALTKVAGKDALAHGDLRAVEAFCIAPTRFRRRELLMDHPPLEKRLAALAEIARELGRPRR
jgi:heat shock protein HtpX